MAALLRPARRAAPKRVRHAACWGGTGRLGWRADGQGCTRSHRRRGRRACVHASKPRRGRHALRSLERQLRAGHHGGVARRAQRRVARVPRHLLQLVGLEVQRRAGHKGQACVARQEGHGPGKRRRRRVLEAQLACGRRVPAAGRGGWCVFVVFVVLVVCLCVCMGGKSGRCRRCGHHAHARCRGWLGCHWQRRRRRSLRPSGPGSRRARLTLPRLERDAIQHPVRGKPAR